MQTICLHLERLRRHYEIAVRTYDHVALLDLSHTLRVWAELKIPLKVKAPSFSTSIAFKNGSPAKKVLRAARGGNYVFSYMPDGVTTFASNGQLVSCPESAHSGTDFTISIELTNTPPSVILGNYCVISKKIDTPSFNAVLAAQVKRCTYIEWLGANAVQLSYVNQQGKQEDLAISREMLIKRIANTLDGSHPSAACSSEDGNTFDAPVHYLLQYTMGGLPLPYFILLKIAEDILRVSAMHINSIGTA